MNEYLFIVIKRTSVSSQKELTEFISRTTLGYIIEKRLYILTMLPVTLSVKGILHNTIAMWVHLPL